MRDCVTPTSFFLLCGYIFTWCNSYFVDGIGIRDPCEKENVGVGENMTVNEREALTAAAQVNRIVSR